MNDTIRISHRVQGCQDLRFQLRYRNIDLDNETRLRYPEDIDWVKALLF